MIKVYKDVYKKLAMIGMCKKFQWLGRIKKWCFVVMSFGDLDFAFVLGVRYVVGRFFVLCGL